MQECDDNLAAYNFSGGSMHQSTPMISKKNTTIRGQSGLQRDKIVFGDISGNAILKATDMTNMCNNSTMVDTTVERSSSMTNGQLLSGQVSGVSFTNLTDNLSLN